MTNGARLGLLAIAMASACEIAPTYGEYCEGAPVGSAEDVPPMTSARVVAQVLPVESTAVDILFVIDNSLSMADEQKQLGIWSSELFDVLASSGELPDLHIAVTSSSVPIPNLKQCDTGGTLSVGSAVLSGGRYLTDLAGAAGRERNYSGTLTDTFAKMALVGDEGCGIEQPFKAARMALSGDDAGSAGFLRDDALLLVVFVTDEDDCSSIDFSLFEDPYADACSELGPLTSYRCFEHGVHCYDGKGPRAFGERRDCRPDESSRYIESVSKMGDFLKGLKPNPAQVVVAGIYGKPNNVTAVLDEKIAYYKAPRLADVCGSSSVEGTGATPAVRMNALLAEFGGRASQSSICDSELSWAMRDVGLITRAAATRSQCLRGPLVDGDLATPGIQPRCGVRITSDAGTALERRSDVPPCDRAGGGRCFTLATDPACAETESQLAVQLDEPAARNETLTVACDVE